MVSDTSELQEALRALKRPTRKSKYGNRITYLNGERFDSKAEAAYNQRLLLLKAAGEIAAFRRQVKIPLGAGIAYVADFVIWATECRGDWYVVDVKGTITKEFRIKAKLFREMYPRHPLIIAQAVYSGGKLAGFRETEFGKRKSKA
jgi:hypothetical protein